MVLPTWCTWWLQSTAGGAVVLLGVWLMARGVRQPARRQRLAEFGVAAALLIPALALLPAWLIVTVPVAEAVPLAAVARDAAPEGFAPSSAEPPVSVEPILVDEETFAALSAEITREVPVVAAVAKPAAEPSATPASADTSIPVPATTPSDPSVRWLPWLAATYLAIVLGFVVRWLIGCVALAALVRTAKAAPPEVAELFATLTAHLRLRPRLLVSEKIAIPLSCGALRPTVILSPGLCRPEAREVLRWVFAHELTHLERRDAWSSHLFGLAQAVYFFLPWFWWLRRQVRLCQEYVADAAACPADAAVDYAQFLLNLRHAPAVPARALGVSGNPSDLFRRVNMLLQSSQKVERSCPRVWSVSAAAVVLAGATFVSGLGLRAEANPLETPRKEEPKKAEEPRKEAPKEELTPENLAREIQKVLKEANAGQPGADPAEMQKRLQQLAQQLQQLQQQQIKFKAVFPGPGGAGGIGGPGGFGLPPGANVRFQVIGQAIGQGGRLGIAGSAPSKVLADQFDLPAGKGLVIDQVVADSAAAKAGLKVHDILLQLDGKDVPSNMGDLARIVDGIKANTAVEAVIFRKGKKETLKGITLAAKEQPMLKGGRFVIGAPVPPFPGLPGQPGAVWVNPMAMAGGLGNGIMTNIFRTDDRFTTRHQEGNLIITITGKVADGKTSLGEIVVQDGAVSNRYESIDKVPEQYRDKAKNLLEMSAKSSVKIEIKNSR